MSIVKVLPPPVRFVGPVDLVGRRRLEEAVVLKGDVGKGLRALLRRCEESVRELEVTCFGVALDLEEEESGGSYAKLDASTKGGASSSGGPLHFPNLTSFHLTPTNLLYPARFLASHSATLQSLTVHLPLSSYTGDANASEVVFPAQLPSLTSLAFLPTKNSPGLNISDATALSKSLLHQGKPTLSCVEALSVTFLSLDIEILRILVRAFPRVKKLELRSPEHGPAMGRRTAETPFYAGSLVSRNAVPSNPRVHILLRRPKHVLTSFPLFLALTSPPSPPPSPSACPRSPPFLSSAAFPGLASRATAARTAPLPSMRHVFRR